MSKLVADDGTDAAEVHRIVHALIEEWRLQNASGEIDVIHLGIVVGIDRGRGHLPLGPVYRMADLGKLAMILKLVGAQRVAESITAHDAERGVIAPFFGIANFARDGLQFHQSLLFGFGRHPRQSLNVVMQCGFKRINHLHGAGFGVGPKGHVNILLAEGLTQIAVGSAHATLPARLLLLGSAQNGAIKVEVFFVEGAGQLHGL